MGDLASIKKILVKCPIGRFSILESFEFLHNLKNDFPEAQIFNICEKGEKFLFDILPFEVHAFEIPPEKSSYLGIHHWIKNLHDIFNIDMYFDLEESLRSNFIAAHYKAQYRIAQENNLNKFVYTHLLKPIEGLRNSDRFLNLLNFEEKKYKVPTEIEVKGEVVGIIKPEEVENFFEAKEVEPFVFIPLSSLDDNFEKFTFWQQLILNLNNHKLIIWTEESGPSVDMLKEMTNEKVVVASEMDPATLSAYFNHAVAVISDNPIYASLSTYYQINSVLIPEENSEDNEAIEFKGKVLKLKKENGVDQVSDQLHEFYNL